jgi:hypothetical protein
MSFDSGVNHCHGRISSINLASGQAETYHHHWSVPSGCVRPHLGQRCGKKAYAGIVLCFTFFVSFGTVVYECVFTMMSEVLTLVKMLMVIYWVVMLCRLVSGYLCFRRTYFLHFQAWRCRQFIWNIDTHLTRPHGVTTQIHAKKVTTFWTLFLTREVVTLTVTLIVVKWICEYR